MAENPDLSPEDYPQLSLSEFRADERERGRTRRRKERGEAPETLFDLIGSEFAAHPYRDGGLVASIAILLAEIYIHEEIGWAIWLVEGFVAWIGFDVLRDRFLGITASDQETGEAETSADRGV